MALKVFKAEWYKVIKSKMIFIILLLGMAYIFIQAIDVYSLLLGFLDIGMENKPLVYGYQAYESIGLDAIMMYFIPFIVVFVFTSEFSKKTMRNLVCSKREKGAVFLGKFCAFCSIIFFLNFILGSIATIVFTITNTWGNNDVVRDVLEVFSLMFRMSLHYISVSSIIILISVLISNEALTVIFFFLGSIIESIFASIFSFSSNKIMIFISECFPTNYLEEFIRKGNGPAWVSIIVCILFSAISGFVLFKKRDIN